MVIDDPRLADLINGPTLRSLLADAERLSGLHASVLDAEGERLPDHDGAASLPRFCQLVQETAEGAARCRRCALRAAFQAAGQQHPHLYHRHAGPMNVA